MKNIILLTRPHTGTNTLVYLFALLGKAPLYFNHISGDQSIRTIKACLELEPDAVYVYTRRDAVDHKRSWFKRYKDDEAQKRYVNMLRANTVVRPYLAQHGKIDFHIAAGPDKRDRVVAQICEEAGVEYTPVMKRFVQLWPKLNSQDGAALDPATQGTLDVLKANSQLGEYLRKVHNYDVNKGVRHGT